MCPAKHHLIGQCFLDVGSPKGVLNIVTNAPKDASDVVNALIAHPAVNHINGPTVGDEVQTPFCGVKSSGYGRFGGTAAINEFTVLRWLTIEDPNQHYPF